MKALVLGPSLLAGFLLAALLAGIAVRAEDVPADGMVDHSAHQGHMMDSGQADMDHSGHNMHDGMEMDAEGMVMNANSDRLPLDCKAISRDYQFTVKAGTKYALAFPGNLFGMSEHRFEVEPCSRITVTFTNEDEVRHQFMIHGLPKYLYPQGMLHIEAVGGATKTGTFIVPSDDKTYLVHCDVAQHMEKGMKGELVVGRGGTALPSVPGHNGHFRRDDYHSLESQLLILFCGVIPAWAILFGLLRRFV